MSRFLSIMLLAVCISLSLSAQETSPASRDTTKPAEVPFYELNEVVVTAPRSARPILQVPMAIDVISAEEIQRAQSALLLSEVFRTVPGIFMDDRNNLSRGDRLVIRGSGSRGGPTIQGAKILLDGIPLTTADGSTTLTTLSLSTLSKVEVIRGPASSLYGNASTGVINMTTAVGQNTPLTLQTRATTGSFNLFKWEANAMGRSGSTGYTVNFDRTKSDGFRQRSEYEVTRFGAVATHDFSSTMQLVGSFYYYDAPYLLNPSSISKAEIETDRTMAAASSLNAGAGRQTNQWIGGLTFKYNDETGQGFDATVYRMSRDQNTRTPPRISESDIASTGARTLYRNRFALGSMPVEWAVGVDFERFTDLRSEFRNLGLPADKRGTTPPDQVYGLVRKDTMNTSDDFYTTSVGPFAQLQMELSPQWILVLGARYDHYVVGATDEFLQDGSDDSGERTLKHFSPSVGLTYRPLQYLSLYANMSNGFQVPGLSELRNRAVGEGGINLDLEPEELTSFEVGLKGVVVGERLAYDLSLFYSDFHDMLIPYQIPGETQAYYRNAGRAINMGVEGKLQWEPLNGLRGTVAFTAMDFKFEDFVVEQTVSGNLTELQLKDNKVPGVAPTRVYAGLSYHHWSGLFSQVYMQWVGEEFANDFNGPPPGGTKPQSAYINEAYTNVDARLGYTHSFSMLELELFAGVNNLFDKHYNASIASNAAADRFFEPSPGRNWYGGLRILFTALK